MLAVNHSFHNYLLSFKPIDRFKIRNILILYDEQVAFIGDCCIRFDMLGLFKSFFPNSSVDINWIETKFSSIYEALLQNNPYLNKASNRDWTEIEFSDYDLVICITFEEDILLNTILDKYSTSDLHSWKTTFISMSKLALNLTSRKAETKFPEYEELLTYTSKFKHEPQLFISQEEQNWAETWLSENGLSRADKLFIILDSASTNYKLLKPEVYHELLTYISTIESAKILIFDEKGIDKKGTYMSLGKEIISKCIFPEKLELRQALSILSSSRTNLIFGPCTGLLHCASGIYNIFKLYGQVRQPLMIVYTGKYQGNDNASVWWNTSPLVNCMILRENCSQKEIVLLHHLNEMEKKDTTNLLPCKEYEADFVISFLKKHMEISD